MDRATADLNTSWRELLARSTPSRVLAGRNGTKADVAFHDLGGLRVVVKDYGPRPAWIRATLGRALVARECAAYGAAAERKGQRIEVEAAASFVRGDAGRLYEVVDNLLNNAVKYTPPGGALRLSLEERAGHVRLTVADSGPGLLPEDREKLFQRFQRLSAKPTGGESSTGLGLAIVKQLVELHGGRVWAESDGPGTGSRFVVELDALPVSTPVPAAAR